MSMKAKNMTLNCGSGLNWHISKYYGLEQSKEVLNFGLQHCSESESELMLNTRDSKGFSYFTVGFATMEDWDDFVSAVLEADRICKGSF